MRLTWVQPEDLLRHELVQSAAEGRDVSAAARAWVEAGGELGAPAGGAGEPPAGPELAALAERLLAGLAAPVQASGDGPDELAAISAGWVLGPARPPASGADLLERLHGAWLGRACGCLLGKPVEKIPREGIREILQAQGRWPLDGYFTGAGLPPELAERRPWNRASRPTSLAEVIDGMPEDDDLNFTMLALRLLELHGPGFTTDDVARLWLSELPAGRVFTAERVAYRNLLEGLEAPATATVRNPFREWIGAQIRTDLYGWTSPGDPARAAAMAWRDARLSHVRNGLYSAMFTAAMGASAVVADSVQEVLAAGLAVIPPQSRLAAAVRLGLRVAEEERDPEAGLDRLHAAFGELHWVHSINNSALVAYALAAGGGDFGRTICLAVTGGWDTDSNGATVGGITGALAGARALPRAWVEPLRNRVASSLRGFDGAGFDGLARRTLAVARLP